MDILISYFYAIESNAFNICGANGKVKEIKENCRREKYDAKNLINAQI